MSAIVDARSIVTTLGGRWHGTYGMCSCICHDDGASPALKISDAPHRTWGIDVFCFAGCPWRDLRVELVRRGLLPTLFPEEPIGEPRAPIKRQQRSDNRAGAIAMWHAGELPEGTLVETYLRSRIPNIRTIPPTIRFVARAKHAPTGLTLPVMVAAVTVAPSRQVVAVHRTFLKPDGSGKADVNSPKMMLGPCAGGAVRLAPTSNTVAIAEGIETGLATMQMTRIAGMPTWAALSTSGMRSVVLPPDIKQVLVAADSDAAGEEAAQVLAARLKSEGRIVIIIHPSSGKDFADALAAGAS